MKIYLFFREFYSVGMIRFVFSGYLRKLRCIEIKLFVYGYLVSRW